MIVLILSPITKRLSEFLGIRITSQWWWVVHHRLRFLSIFIILSDANEQVNRFASCLVTNIAHAISTPCAAPGNKTEALAQQVAKRRVRSGPLSQGEADQESFVFWAVNPAWLHERQNPRIRAEIYLNESLHFLQLSSCDKKGHVADIWYSEHSMRWVLQAVCITTDSRPEELGRAYDGSHEIMARSSFSQLG